MYRDASAPGLYYTNRHNFFWMVMFVMFVVQGSRIQVKGIPDVARHTSVTVVPCKDADNFEYPKGLLCAAEKGYKLCVSFCPFAKLPAVG
jgi:hypothetical protein